MVRIHRSFHDLKEGVEDAAEQAAIFAQMGIKSETGWSDLLQSPRVLVVSEAGAGKTYECRAERDERWAAGEPAFFFELAELSCNDPCDLLDPEELRRFDAWRVSQSDVAIVFLDSIDELKLTLGNLENALKRLKRAVDGHLGRLKVVITSRPIPIERALLERLLPVPDFSVAEASEQAFADLAMHRSKAEDKDRPVDWRCVALMPLSNEQIRAFAELEGVTDADAMLEDIRKRNAEEFARRPQDLIELCADWRDHHRIRTHREQVAHNISVKLKPRSNGREVAHLTNEQALEGASRLAFAMLLTRKLTIRHSAEADRGGAPGTASDPAVILTGWSGPDQKTLLERALFGFAGYGRVRFHHRSVVEYLAAHRFSELLDRGMSVKAVKRMLFAESPYGDRVVRPSMRPVAAWLSISRPEIYAEVCEREPEVLLNHGDPESLTIEMRASALRAYVGRYGEGHWRGMHVPRLQVHRFAAPELGPEVLRLWNKGISSPEVRELLLEIIAAAAMPAGADIAYAVAMTRDAGSSERMDAIDVLVTLGDPRLEEITCSIAQDPVMWPSKLAELLIPKLFPSYLPVDRLCRVLGRLNRSPRSVDYLDHFWSPLIASAKVSKEYLSELREGMVGLVCEELKWHSEWCRFTSERQDLLLSLASVCLRQIADGEMTDELLWACVLVLRLERQERQLRGDQERIKKLRAALADGVPWPREKAFWMDDAFCQRFHPTDKVEERFYELSQRGPFSFNSEADKAWVLTALSDAKRPQAERALMLEAALYGVWDGQGDWRDYAVKLAVKVADVPELAAALEEKIRPRPVDPKWEKMRERHRKQGEDDRRRAAKNHASWIQFWREVASQPQMAFSPDKSGNTAWSLWQVMSRSGEESRSSGWSRRFIEKYFSKDVADHLRVAMGPMWRSDRPTLRSERTEGEKDTYLIRWQLGLAAIAAEAEDKNWARKLSRDEAELAARYVPMELNGFPSWFEALVLAHPAAVDAVLGPELLDELKQVAKTHVHCMFLQCIRDSSEDIKRIFLPRIQTWLESFTHEVREGEDATAVADRLRRVVDLLLKAGDAGCKANILADARQQLGHDVNSAFAWVWLPVLIRLNPDEGVDQLEKVLNDLGPLEQDQTLKWFSFLFGDRSDCADGVRDVEFTPALLLRLVRLAYRYVPPSGDAVHEGSFTPGLRDHAERGRGALVHTLLNARGSDGWAAKIEMANDPMFSHFRDRALHLSMEKAAEEAESAAMQDSQAVAIDRYRESPPVTREEVFQVLKDRLDDIDELLLRDYSPRAAWALILEEKVMRREIARELARAANHSYIVDQESVTADEKETDIRLRATASEQQAVIELKLADKRSGRDLRDTIRDQLVKKYMASELCRSGCLLITVASDGGWDHPDSKARLDVDGLRAMLEAERAQVVAELSGLLPLHLEVRLLDLRPRLSTEKSVVRAKSPGA
ncbi:ATP-binding protein [Aquabacterium sp.]|uniref:ATP-binding protein n=1 Tax=Aquabacterium sp. TaxID=1872578 RepID=UPI002488357E|nr:ATP-binding protein [Aquabacterium sp.]MDI1259211.1 ATP-binding protein [Aquabacterium sp.]